jgi:glycine betaine catabolism A
MAQAVPFDPKPFQDCVAPFGEARTLPAEAYTSPEVFAWEQERFLEGSWLCLGRSDGLGRPGDQRAIRAGREAILLVRGKDEILRGFFNTCRHRGHELLPCGGPSVNRRFVRCPYHSWTYGLDGRFRAAPDFEDRTGWRTDDPDNSLAPARVEEWGGWVFVNADAAAPPLSEHVGNLDDAIRPYEPEALVVGAEHDYVVRANWKLVHENYHECYHCSNIHPELCRVTPPESGSQFESTGLVVGGSMDLMDHADTMSLTGRSEGEPLPGLDQARRRIVEYWGMFPNLLISAHPDYVLTHRLEPLSNDRTRIECQWLFPRPVAERPGFDPAYAVEFWDITNKQDWSACEGVQRGAEGRGYRQGPLSPMEVGVYQFIALAGRGYLEGRVRGPVPSVEVTAAGGG